MYLMTYFIYYIFARYYKDNFCIVGSQLLYKKIMGIMKLKSKPTKSIKVRGEHFNGNQIETGSSSLKKNKL